MLKIFYQVLGHKTYCGMGLYAIQFPMKKGCTFRSCLVTRKAAPSFQSSRYFFKTSCESRSALLITGYHQRQIWPFDTIPSLNTYKDQKIMKKIPYRDLFYARLMPCHLVKAPSYVITIYIVIYHMLIKSVSLIRYFRGKSFFSNSYISASQGSFCCKKYK